MPYDPAVPLLGMYLEKTKSEKDICTPVLIEVLLTIAKTWKQPKCPLTQEWIKKMQCSGILLNHKKNEIMLFVATQMDLEIIILNKARQTEKDKYHIACMWDLKIKDTN